MDIVKRGEVGRDALFEDADFPPDDRSLFSDGSSPLARLQGDVTWRRPQVRAPPTGTRTAAPPRAQRKITTRGKFLL